MYVTSTVYFICFFYFASFWRNKRLNISSRERSVWAAFRLNARCKDRKTTTSMSVDTLFNVNMPKTPFCSYRNRDLAIWRQLGCWRHADVDWSSPSRRQSTGRSRDPCETQVSQWEDNQQLWRWCWRDVTVSIGPTATQRSCLHIKHAS